MSFPFEHLSDVRFTSENTLPARSDHSWQLGTTQTKSEQSLNGEWKFHYSESLLGGEESLEINDAKAETIEVPSHIELSGWGRPQYVNTQYPWDGHETLEAGQAPSKCNTAGTYSTNFEIEDIDYRRILRFEGVESAFAVWVNGEYTGYATDTFTAHEFDVTRLVHRGENTLMVRVYKWSAASWLEDQDFFRFSGIFRDVNLIAYPDVHLQDIQIDTDVSADLSHASLCIKPRVLGNGHVRAELTNVGTLETNSDGSLSLSFSEPTLWNAEEPHLYDLRIELLDAADNLVESVRQQIGFRRIEIKDSIFLVNGKRIVFKGVNRHEFGIRGRVVSKKETEEDLKLLKRLGINAIRTSHYPNNSFFYDLADEYGFYVIDEVNLESHGLWDEVLLGLRKIEDSVPGNDERWLAPLLYRAENMFKRDRNHACIVAWSCGNESLGGKNLFEVANYFRRNDSRPVHYEGVHWDPRFPETTDITSQMYTSAEELTDFLKNNRDKPVILCEFAHSMGNSFGAVDRYMDLTRSDPLFQGGFIWDFADQAIMVPDELGTPQWLYGGQNGEMNHDGDFCGNGIFFADRTPKPQYWDVKYQYQNLYCDFTSETMTVKNGSPFVPSNHFRCVIRLLEDGIEIAKSELRTHVPPNEQRTYRLPDEISSRIPQWLSNEEQINEGRGEFTLESAFSLKETKNWAPAGYEVAFSQHVLGGKPRIASGTETAAKPMTIIDGTHNLGVKVGNAFFLFSKIYGGLQGIDLGSGNILKSIPMPNFWHAPTSNERGWGGPFDDAQWLLASRYAKFTRTKDNPRLAIDSDESFVEITFDYELPTVPASQCSVTYAVDSSGALNVKLDLFPGDGLLDPPEFALMIETQKCFSNLEWYGYGPGETYPDRLAGSRLGVYQASVDNELAPHLKPQESGNHSGVRWATVSTREKDGDQQLFFVGEPLMDFSALSWSPFEIENAASQIELPRIHSTFLRPAFERRGVGGDDSWQAPVLDQYRLPKGELSFTFSIRVA